MATAKPHAKSELLVMALDVGSSSVRASLYDQHGQAVENMAVKASHLLSTTADGGVETDPDELLQVTLSTIDQLLHKCGKRAELIRAVAIDTFWHGLIGIDRHHKAVTPMLSWADTRSEPYAAKLRESLDHVAYHARTGCYLHPSYFPAKIAWLAEAEPDKYKQVEKWVSFGEYLYLQLFGETVISLSMASGTGLLNVKKAQWDDEILNCLKISPDNLLPLGDFDQANTELRPEYAQRWPMLHDVRWFPAVGDGATSNLGAGCYADDKIAVMVGTSGAMRIVCDSSQDIPVPWGLWGYRVDKRRLIMGGALSEGGNLIHWLHQTLQLPDFDTAEPEVAKLQPDAHGLTFLPFLTGERSPGYAAHARATISGLSLDNTPYEILRAGMEAIAYRFGMLYALIGSARPDIKTIVASGGGLLHSPTWVQIIADVLNQPVTVSSEGEASARGAALMALEQLGTFGADKGLENAEYDFGKIYKPVAKRHEIYHKAMQRQQQLYDLLVQQG